MQQQELIYTTLERTQWQTEEVEAEEKEAWKSQQINNSAQR